MKHKSLLPLTSILLTISIILGMIPSYALAESESNTVIISEDFENGFVPDGWSAPEASTGTSLKVENGVLAMSCVDDATLRVSKDFTAIDTVCTYEFRFKTDSSFINFAYTGGTGGVGMFFTLKNNVLTATYGDGSGNSTSQAFVVARGINPDVWTHLKVEVAAIYNMVDPAITIYVNNKMVLTDVALWQPLKNVSYFWFGMNSKGTLYIDDVQISAAGDKFSPVDTTPERSLRRVSKENALQVIEANDRVNMKTYSDNVGETYIPIVTLNPLAENGYHLSQTGVLHNHTDLYFDVPESGNYIFTLRYGTNAQRPLGLIVNGEDMGNIDFARSGTNQLRDFTDLSLSLPLRKGKNIVSLLGIGKGNILFECFMLHRPSQITDGNISSLLPGGSRQYLPVTDFTDIAGHKYSKEIEYCTGRGFFKEKTDRFRPDDEITRAEFIQVLLNSLGYNLSEEQEYISKALELSFLPTQLTDINEMSKTMLLLDARLIFDQIEKIGYFRDSLSYGNVLYNLNMVCETPLTRGVVAKIFCELHSDEEAGYSYRRQAYLRRVMQKPVTQSNARSMSNRALLSLWFGENIKEANELLCDKNLSGMVTYEEFEGGNVPYWTVPSLLRSFYGFHKDYGKYGKLLTARTQDILIEMMWNFVNVYSKFILGSGLDPNVVQGTENHTLHMASSIYLASQYLSKDERYKNRLFENGYSSEQYVELMEKYFFDTYRNKASNGLFIEGSATYLAVSLQGIYNIYDFTENPQLKEATRMFLDIFWIQHGLESINNVMGGAKAREYIRWSQIYNWALSSLGAIYFDNSLTHLGDYADIETDLLSDYRPPELARMLSASPEERGRVATTLRQPGIGYMVREEETGVPMFYHSDTESVLRYTYATPNYVMGSFVRNTSMQYSVLSDQNRWEGVVFKNPVSGRIFPRYVSGETGSKAFITMQNGPVMLGQRGQNRNVEIYVLPYVKLNSDGDVDLVDGWYFDEYDGIYYGIKAASGTLTLSASKHLLLTDSDSHFIIHMGDSEQDGTFEEFCNRLRNNEITSDDTEITYTDPILGTMRLVSGSNAENIRFINGKAVDMKPERVIDSPYIWGNFAEGKLYTKYNNETILYDFTDFTVKPVR